MKENILSVQIAPENLTSRTTKEIESYLRSDPLADLMLTAKSNVEAAKFSIIPQPNMILKKNLQTIFIEHCYSRPHTWRPEANFLRPTSTLFMPPKAAKTPKRRSNPLAPTQKKDPDDMIDVETVSIKPPPVYDLGKAMFLMDECERHAKFARVEQGDAVWDEYVPKLSWTANQSRLFANMVEILNSEHMARLAYKGNYNEPAIRRTLIDKTVKRFRLLMSTVSWDLRLSQWLHQVLTDNMSMPYLAIYLDMLQTLKSKLPSFADRLMFGPSQLNRVGVTSNESLFPLLKRRWDPCAGLTPPPPSPAPTTAAGAAVGGSTVAPAAAAGNGCGGGGSVGGHQEQRTKRLPGNPVIVVVPGTPTAGGGAGQQAGGGGGGGGGGVGGGGGKRLANWISLLGNLAPVYTVFANIGTGGHRMTIMTCLEQMFASTRAKVQEVKAEHPGRSLVLVGVQGAGAALALQVAQVESVLCCVCVGFGVHTADGRRGQPDDHMLELQAPVLFVIGQCATTARQEEMEDLRERMRVETGLVVVGGADDYLRISKKKRRAHGVTQSYVDRCIVDEIGVFVSGILLSPYPAQMRQSPTHITSSNPTVGGNPSGPTITNNTTNVQDNRKRNNSNGGSSLDSEPASPLPLVIGNGGQLQPPRMPATRPGHISAVTAASSGRCSASASAIGRPPGSKMRNKWSNYNQGTPTKPLTPTPTFTITPLPKTVTHNPSASHIATTVTTTPSIATLKGANNSNNNINSNNTANTASVGGAPVAPAKADLQHGNMTAEKATAPIVIGGAKLQALASRGVISHNIISTASGIRTIPPVSKNNSIKVLNNITIATTAGPSAGIKPPPPQYPARLTALKHPAAPAAHHPLTMGGGGGAAGSNSGTYGNIMLMADGKLKNCGPKYITSKKQLVHGRLGQKQIRTIPILHSTGHTTTINTALPPPTNLTSQEIMDLPIIFADDDNSHQILQHSGISTGSETTQILTLPQSSVKTQGKLVLVNKSNMFPANILKRPAPSLQKPSPSGIKYAKIILSKCPPTILNEDVKNKSSPGALQLPTDLSVRKLDANPSTSGIKVEVDEPFDLEKELVATAVVKPTGANIDPKLMTFIYKGDSVAPVNQQFLSRSNFELKKMLEDTDTP